MTSRSRKRLRPAEASSKHILAVAVDEQITFCLGRYTNERIVEQGEVTVWPLRLASAVPDIKHAVRDYLGKLPKDVMSTIDAISVSAFGLTDSHSGQTTAFRRPGWRRSEKELIWSADILDDRWSKPIFLHNDATCAALGEYLTSHEDLHLNEQAEPRQQAFAFIRVGAGVNVGLVINGHPWQGDLHPEFGHIRPKRFEVKSTSGRVVWADNFSGLCDAHKDCLEGLICKEARQAPGRAPSAERLNELLAYYLGYMCVLVTMTMAPRRIVIGGSAITPELHAMAAQEFATQKADYPLYKAAMDSHDFIRLAAGGPDVNLVGALEWARVRLHRDQP